MGTNTDEALVTIGPLTVLIVIIACCCWCWCKCCKKCRRNPSNNSRPHVVVDTQAIQPLTPAPVIHQPPPETATQPLMPYPQSPPPPYPGQPMFPQPYPPQGYPPSMQAYPPHQMQAYPPPTGPGVTMNFFQQSAVASPPNCPLPPIPLQPNLPPNCPLPPIPTAVDQPSFKQPEYNPDYAPSAPR